MEQVLSVKIALLRVQDAEVLVSDKAELAELVEVAVKLTIS